LRYIVGMEQITLTPEPAHDLANKVAGLLRDLPGVGALRSAQARADWILADCQHVTHPADGCPNLHYERS